MDYWSALVQEKPHRDETNWEVLNYSIKTAAREVLGKRHRRRPKKFEDSLEILLPLMEAKNSPHARSQPSLVADKRGGLDDVK